MKPAASARKSEASNETLQEARRLLLPVIVGGAVHELNQPLTMLNFVSDTLQLFSERNTPTSAIELGELAADTASGAKRLQGIAEHLRELSSDDEQLKQINLNDAVNDCMRLIGSKIRGLGYQTTLTLKATSPVVLCSSVKLSYLIFSALFYVSEMTDGENRRRPTQKILFVSAQTANEIVLSCRRVSSVKTNRAAKNNARLVPLLLVQALAKDLGGAARVVLNKKKQPILETRFPLHV